MNIAQIKSLPDASWVSGPLVAWVGTTFPPKGNGPAKAKLTDSSGEITASIWGGDIGHWAGKQVELSGKGMKMTIYKGEPQLSVGDKVVISAVSEAAPPASQQRQAPRAMPTLPAHPGHANGAAIPIHGATVGGALARAVDVWLRVTGPDQANGWGDTDIELVEKITRDLVGIQQRVESGAPPKESTPF